MPPERVNTQALPPSNPDAVSSIRAPISAVSPHSATRPPKPSPVAASGAVSFASSCHVPPERANT